MGELDTVNVTLDLGYDGLTETISAFDGFALTKPENPVNGNTVYSTIDLNIQTLLSVFGIPNTQKLVRRHTLY